MKKIIVTLTLVLTINFCVGQEVPSGKQNHDPVLLGSWSGTEKSMQKVGMVKHWIQNRFEDGTFVLIYTTIEDDVVKNFSEKGKWWTENGKFYELHFRDDKTNIYTYELVDESHVKFEGIKLGSDFEKKEYESTESKVEYSKQ
jgi:hypothetical protein